MLQCLVLLFFLSTGITVVDIDLDYLEKDEIFKLEDSEYFINQSISNATFEMIVSSYDVARFIFFEIQFENPKDGNVNFLSTVCKNELTILKNGTIITTYVDLNGFQLHKSYHYIVIPAYSFNSRDKFLISNFITNDRRSYQYFFKIQKLSTKPCPNGCNQNSGVCVDGICLCNKNKIDLDCSKDAISVQLDQKIYVEVYGTQYFQFEQEIQLDHIQLNISLSNNSTQQQTEVSLYLHFEDFELGAPITLDQNYNLTKEKNSIKKRLDISKLNYNQKIQRFNRLLIKLVTNVKSPLYFEISKFELESSEDEVAKRLTIILLLIGCIFGLFGIAYIIYRCRNRCAYINRFQNPQVHPQGTQDSKIELKQLEQSMLKAQREEHNANNFECSICLEDDEKIELRLTQCQHLFHVKCLHVWLLHKSELSCPICRDKINLEIISYQQRGLIMSKCQSSHNLSQNQSY